MVYNYLNDSHMASSKTRLEKPTGPTGPTEPPELPAEGPDVWIEKGYPSGPTGPSEPAKPEPEPPEEGNAS